MRDKLLPSSEATRADLEEQVAFTLSDASRLLRKADVEGACPHPDDCFYESDRVRCGPCAVKASAARGVEIDDTHSHLPEVCRHRREVKAAQARIAELEADPARQTNLRVKPLEWHRYPTDGHRSFEGQNDKREYISRAILPWGRSLFLMMKNGFFTLEDDPDTAYRSEKALKDAVQEKYDAWILAAIISEGQP